MCLEYIFHKSAELPHQVEVGFDRLADYFGQYTPTGVDEFFVIRREVHSEIHEWLDANTPGWINFNFKVVNSFCFQTKEHAMLFKLTWA